MKMCSVGAELFYADRQTGMTKLIAVFCNFANTPKNDMCVKPSLVTPDVLPLCT
jgi:hypothetical protein